MAEKKLTSSQDLMGLLSEIISTTLEETEATHGGHWFTCGAVAKSLGISAQEVRQLTRTSIFFEWEKPPRTKRGRKRKKELGFRPRKLAIQEHRKRTS
tara:strand:- start:5055 stop:5348 length:294 start_codon:yes stop_codon:yes gene_type:complete